MIEEIITSGRHNPEIDPNLHVWGWEIPLYLFIGGLVAGILFFSALLTILGKENKYAVAAKWIPIGTPFLIAIGLIALLLDLSHMLYFWQLFTNIRWESPMSWGAWTLLIMTPLSVLWVFSWLPDILPKLDLKYNFIKLIQKFLISKRIFIAWGLLILSIILGMYTGILLSAFNARPFWNTSILGPLFLTSGFTGGAATIVFFTKSTSEKLLFNRIVIALIIVESFLLIHLFMGLLAGTEVHIKAAEMFLGGEFTTKFWLFDILLGLAFPLVLKVFELYNRKIPAALPFILIIFGNIMLRFTVVEAGQASRWLY